LKNILYNLVENAIKFTHDEGSINVEVKRDNNVVLFLVHDTGIGIENENIERIFEPFVQMDGSISRKIDGTGLGLALVKKRIEMHGGHIRIESELGKGSIFIFEIPLNSSIPVIAITASYRGNDDREFYLKSGFSEYIFKPMTVDNMKDILRIYLEPPNH
jgi:signal transduction histidine kinase